MWGLNAPTSFTMEETRSAYQWAERKGEVLDHACLETPLTEEEYIKTYATAHKWYDTIICRGTNPYNPNASTVMSKECFYSNYAYAHQEATGVKHDNGKPPMELLDSDALEGLARVLEFGAKKYAAHNWRGGIHYGRLIGALLRHTFAIIKGEDTDPESGLPHIDHVGCCWMFLSNMMKNRPDLDDRYGKSKPETTNH